MTMDRVLTYVAKRRGAELRTCQSEGTQKCQPQHVWVQVAGVRYMFSGSVGSLPISLGRMNMHTGL